MSGAFGVIRRGTGITTYALDDLLYCSAADTPAKIAGNTATTHKVLHQTGTGSTSAAPAWGALPAHTHAAGDVTSGKLSLASGGEAAGLSATGPRLSASGFGGSGGYETTG